MAIYHLSAKMISRSSGRSAIASAAYRSGEKLYDERQDHVFNYRGKEEQVLFSEILIPDGTPDWMKNREQLWNMVEASEKQKNSQVSREIELALPRELSVSENSILLKEFVNEQFIKERLVADINIHSEDRGNENIHAHVMLTTRRVIDGQFYEKKARDLDKKEILVEWREEWANKVNYHLALNGHDIQIDHRSYKDQGIDLEPQNKRGSEFAKDRLVEKNQEHQDIAARNGERIYDDPYIAIKAISAQQSTFTKQDIARFINRHTVDQEQFSRVFEKVYASSELVLMGHDNQGQERYSTREMITLEKEMLYVAKELSERSTHDIENPEHDRFSMAFSRFGREIKSMFIEDQEKDFDYLTLSEEQKVAIEHITKGNDLACVLGYAGTGKSYMLGAARELWEKEGYQVRGLALAGIAARGLEDGSGIQSQTIARQFINWENGRERLSERDIVVLDEAGMVASRQFHRLLGEIKESGAKLVLTGDFNQIPPIEAGAAARAVMEKIGYVELNEVKRQIEPWQQKTTKLFAKGEIDIAIDNYYQKGFVHIAHQFDGSQIDRMITKWAENRLERPYQSQIMIAFTNKEVKQLNKKAREIASELGKLGKNEHEIETAKGILKFAEKEQVIFLRNNNNLGVMNGMIGEVKSINKDEMTVVINKLKKNQREITFDTKNYNYLDYGYAATIHKVQGATYDHVQVLASNYFNRNITYVACTRHREELNIYYDFKNINELKKVMNREGGKDTTLDYQHLSKEILKYKEIQPLTDLDYTVFHNRELIKELQLTGEKEVSFDIGKIERGLIAGTIEHNDRRYIVLEQEKEFKLFNQKLFSHFQWSELENKIGHFVDLSKTWDSYLKKDEMSFSDRGSPVGPVIDSKELLYGETKDQYLLVLGDKYTLLNKNIAALENKYEKSISFELTDWDKGIYRGITEIAGQEMGILETKSELKIISTEYFKDIKVGSGIKIEKEQEKFVVQEADFSLELNRGRGY